LLLPKIKEFRDGQSRHNHEKLQPTRRVPPSETPGVVNRAVAHKVKVAKRAATNLEN